MRRVKRSPISFTVRTRTSGDHSIRWAAAQAVTKYLAHRRESKASVAPSLTAKRIARQFRPIASSHSAAEQPPFGKRKDRIRNLITLPKVCRPGADIEELNEGGGVSVEHKASRTLRERYSALSGRSEECIGNNTGHRKQRLR